MLQIMRRTGRAKETRAGAWTSSAGDNLRIFVDERGGNFVVFLIRSRGGHSMRLWGNDYNRMEFAGAFGDLGTLIPFVVGYITLNKLDPVGILVAFGLFKIFVGLYFRTPVPIQPMKAIGGMAIAHASTITPGMIWGSGIFTGVFWLVMGLTGAITWIQKVTTKPVVRGIMLGLGLSFVVEGLGMMRTEPLFAIGGGVLTLLLLNSKRYPAMLALLA